MGYCQFVEPKNMEHVSGCTHTVYLNWTQDFCQDLLQTQKNIALKFTMYDIVYLSEQGQLW